MSLFLGYKSKNVNRQNRIRKLFAEALECRRVFASIPITTATYNQDFDTLGTTGTTNTTLPEGWEFLETLANANANYRADNGTGNTGDTYSFGATGSTERAFGTLQSGSLISTIGASFINSTSSPFTALVVGYTGEQWRVGAASRPDRLDFQYSLDATSLNTGTWFDVDSLDFNSIQSATAGAKDGNSAGFRTLVSSTIPATVPAGATIYIRWNDFNATGTDDGIGIDDFSITATSTASLSISAEATSKSRLEGNSGTTAFTYNVVRTGPSTDVVTVNWAVSGAGQYPTVPADFAAPLSGTLSFAAGVTSLPLTINVNGDTIIEPDKTFAVTLSNATNVTTPASIVGIGTASDSSTVVNDDLQSLIPGDLVITGINTTNPDQFSFVPLVDLAGNLPIKFTDSGWDASLSTPAIVNTEGTVMYVTPEAGVPKGTKVVIEVLGTATVMRTGPGTSIVTGNFGLNSTGENLFAFQGDIASAQFLFGVNTGISYLATGGGAIANATTYLPPTLTIGSSAVAALGQASGAAVANGEFNHSAVVGTYAQLNAAVADVTKWNASTSPIALSPSNFTIGNNAQISIQAGAVSAAEGTSANTTFAFTVTRGGDGQSAQTIDFTLSGFGSSPANAADFVGNAFPSGTITFPADGTLTRTISIVVAADSVIELDESFVVTLSNPSSGLAIGNGTSTGVIQNDDLQPLLPGDVVITGINATNPDQFSFVPLVDLTENTQILFTDNAWDGTALASNEGTVTYVVPAGGVSRGTKVVVTVSGVVTIVGPGNATTSPNFALNASGENLFAYLGSSTSPNFLYAVNTNVSYLTTGTVSASTTYLPSSLTVGQSALAPLGTAAAVANAEYDHTKGIGGSPSAVTGLVSSVSNWTTSATAIALNTTNFTVISTLAVDSISQGPSSVVVRFSKPLDVTKLNLVDSNNVNGTSDVTLVGNTVGAVSGSVVLDADARGFTFVKSGGVLAADTYTLTLRSAANGFTDATGNLLDGDANGTPGDNFVRTFTVAAIPDTTVVLSVGDFIRGAGQTVNLPTTTTNGIPVTISTGVNVAGASFELRYNPALLTITGGTTPIAGATVTVNTTTAGVAIVSVTSSAQFSATAGALTLVNLAATVPTTAPIGPKSVLRLANPSVTAVGGAALTNATDDGLQISAYKGDVNNSNSITTGDVTGLLRTISGGLSTTGFPSFKLADPTIVGDMNDSSSLTTGDATGLLRFISGVGGGFPAIPALPTGLTPVLGADPQIFVPQNLTVTPGNSIQVPINIRVTEPAGVSVAGVDVSFTYDSTRFTIGAITTGAALNGFTFSSSNNTAVAGVARLVYASDIGPAFPNGFVGTLLNVTLTARADAAPGASAINLTRAGASDNDTNDLTIAPAITNGVDSSDGIITIPGAANQAPTGLALAPTTIAENAGANATVGTLTTTDPDTGDTFVYTLVTGTGSTDNAAFNISGSTLRANASFDFETKSSYSVRVRTTDQGGLFFEREFVITVTNVNETPVFNPTSYTFGIAENSATGTAVGTVSATDVDAGTSLVYSLTGVGAANFAINASTGAITVAAGAVLNFEGTNLFSLTASVTDGTLSTTAPVTINVTNVNESPVFAPPTYTFALAENSATGAAVGTVTATDVEGTALTYSLSGTGAANFVINTATGAITVAAGAVLDFEGTQTFNLTATASDGTLSATAPVTINLTNVNEAPAFNPATYTFSLAENSATGAAVGTVVATDVDAGTTLTYSLSGTGSANFVINTATGAITVAAGAVLDFEGTRTFNLTATASDGTLSATAPVTINLTNVNEAPAFNPATYTFSLAENSATGAAVGTVVATDVDAGTTLTYSLSGTGSANFVINTATGAITVAAGAVLDFEGTRTFNLTATASDGTLSATAPVTINLTNVNEAPVFNPATYTFSLSDNAATGAAVGTVVATDVDAGTTLTYSLSGTGSANFVINTATGAITVAAGASLNAGTTPVYNLTATVSDGTLSATAPVTINVSSAPVAPRLVSVAVNGGDTFKTPAQRSEVTSLVVTFSAPVTIAAGAFSIVDVGLLSAQNPVLLPQPQLLITPNAANTQFTIRFGAGPGVITRGSDIGQGRGNSLADGNYVLSLDATKISDGVSNLSATNSLGDGDNEFGDLATDAFFRMFGDSNGDGLISTSDTAAFRASLTAYDAAFDWDGDGTISGTGIDRTNFLGNFGKRRRV